MIVPDSQDVNKWLVLTQQFFHPECHGSNTELDFIVDISFRLVHLLIPTMDGNAGKRCKLINQKPTDMIYIASMKLNDPNCQSCKSLLSQYPRAIGYCSIFALHIIFSLPKHFISLRHFYINNLLRHNLCLGLIFLTQHSLCFF